MEGTPKNNKGLVIFLVIALCASLGVIAYLMLKPTENTELDVNISEKAEDEKTEDQEESKEEKEDAAVIEEIGSYPNLYTNKLNKENIIELYDRYIHVYGMIYEPNLANISYDKVMYVGYTKSEKYYKIIGTYTCHTTEIPCVYDEQGSDPVSGSTYDLYSPILVFEKESETSDYYTLKSVVSGALNYEDMTSTNEEIN